MTSPHPATQHPSVVEHIQLDEFTSEYPAHVRERVSVEAKVRYGGLVSRVDDVMLPGETCIVGAVARRGGDSGILVVTSRRLVWLKSGGNEILAVRRDDVDDVTNVEPARIRRHGAPPWQRVDVPVVEISLGEGETTWIVRDDECKLGGALSLWVAPETAGTALNTVRVGARTAVVVSVLQPVGYVTLDDGDTVAVEWRSAAAPPQPGEPVMIVSDDRGHLVAMPAPAPSASAVASEPPDMGT